MDPKRAKVDRRRLQAELGEPADVDALADAHQGAGRKPRSGYLVDDVERLRGDWFVKNEAVDPDEVTGQSGSSREDALTVLGTTRTQSQAIGAILDSIYYQASSLIAVSKIAGAQIGWRPAGSIE